MMTTTVEEPHHRAGLNVSLMTPEFILLQFPREMPFLTPNFFKETSLFFPRQHLVDLRQCNVYCEMLINPVSMYSEK